MPSLRHLPNLPISGTSVLLLFLSVFISVAAFVLARVHLDRVSNLLSGQTRSIVAQLARLPETDRIEALLRKAPPGSVEWRIGDEAFRADDATRAASVDAVLADMALVFEHRAIWPRVSARIAAACGVLLMALAISLHLEVFVIVALFVIGVASAVLCVSVGRRSEEVVMEQRRSVDALVDVLALRDGSELASGRVAYASRSRRLRRR